MTRYTDAGLSQLDEERARSMADEGGASAASVESEACLHRGRGRAWLAAGAAAFVALVLGGYLWSRRH
jgi:hypothetical protein